MAIEHRSTVDQIEIPRTGDVQVRFALEIVEGDKVHSRAWHRTTFVPGADIDQQMAFVNAHLALLGRAPVGQDDIERIKAQALAAWTPEVLARER